MFGDFLAGDYNDERGGFVEVVKQFCFKPFLRVRRGGFVAVKNQENG